MDLGIMAQRLVVSDALDRRGDRFAVQNAALAERKIQTEAAAAQAFEYLQLHLAHELYADLPRGIVVHNMEERIFLLQYAQLFQNRMRVGLFGMDAVGEHRLKQRGALPLFRAERVAGVRGGQPRYGADRSGTNLVGKDILLPGVQADLVDLLFRLPVLRRDLHRSAGAKRPARYAQPGEPGALRVAADFVDPRAEVVPGGLCRCVQYERIEQLIHAVKPERGAEKAREQLLFRDQAANLLRRNRPSRQKALERRFALGSGLLHPLAAGKVRAFRREKGAKLLHPGSTVHAGEIGFIDK